MNFASKIWPLNEWEEVNLNRSYIYCINGKLQSKHITVDCAVNYLTVLIAALQEIRYGGIEVSDVFSAISSDCFFEEKRARKRKKLTLEGSNDTVLKGKQRFSVDFHPVLEKVLSQRNGILNVSQMLQDFNFIPGKSIISKTVNELNISAKRLASKYLEYLDAGV